MGIRHKNFFENIPEAHIRLLKTVVLYDNEPYSVKAITDHKKDGIFRIYIEPLVDTGQTRYDQGPNAGMHSILQSYNPASEALGTELDKWLASNKSATLLRKQMNSPLFNRFRPFPLGMVNTGEKGNGCCYYIERQPLRQREQGLTHNMLMETKVSCGETYQHNTLNAVNMYQEYFRDMIKGQYPSAKTCLDALMDSDVTNEALAFSRIFAFVRGPLDVLYLGYKDEIVGRLPRDNLSVVQLGKRFRQLKETITEAKIFDTVEVK